MDIGRVNSKLVLFFFFHCQDLDADLSAEERKEARYFVSETDRPPLCPSAPNLLLTYQGYCQARDGF